VSEEDKDPYVNEHRDLIKSIMDGKPLNEGKQVAESTLTAIMGRISAYTGQQVSYSWVLKGSKLDLSPPKYELGDYRVNPVPIPGEIKLV
jgi:myo-inositol 2-dehydrogenase / D-chiro-inositol 1-dehydrogenase